MNIKSKIQSNKAFTLVELAIVIVIIGLLVGGVLQGQELIRQAKYRSAMKSIEGYKAAINGFFAKYNCLPGDCNNAHKFFADKNCGTNTIITSTNINGCNGDGDKVLSVAEGQNIWAHLSYGGFINGSFTPGYKTSMTAGVDVPMVPIKDSVGASAVYSQGDRASTSCGFYACTSSPTSAVNIFGYMLNRNVLLLGNVRISTFMGGEHLATGAFITPADAYEFDLKFDDGVMFSGTISGFKGRLPDGTPGACQNGQPPEGNYNLNGNVARNSETCMLVFDAGF